MSQHGPYTKSTPQSNNNTLRSNTAIQVHQVNDFTSDSGALTTRPHTDSRHVGRRPCECIPAKII